MVRLLSVEGMDKVAVSVLTYIGGVSSPLTLVFLLRFSGGICGSSVRQGSSSCRVCDQCRVVAGQSGAYGNVLHLADGAFNEYNFVVWKMYE